jgi:hypothetical protein
VSEVREATKVEEQILRAFDSAKAEYPTIANSPHSFTAFCKGWSEGYKLGSQETADMLLAKVKEHLGSKP